MKYLIYPRTMGARIKPELQIECDSISRHDGVLFFERLDQAPSTPDFEIVAAMAPGTWGVVTTADGLKAYEATESEVEPMFPDPTKETP